MTLQEYGYIRAAGGVIQTSTGNSLFVSRSVANIAKELGFSVVELFTGLFGLYLSENQHHLMQVDFPDLTERKLKLFH